MAEKRFYRAIALLVILLAFNMSYAQTHEVLHDSTHTEENGFKPGTFIMDHIADGYYWHIMDIPENFFGLGNSPKAVAIPLLAILYSEHSGFQVFSTSKFHHGHEAYNGFEIAHEGEYRGKIIEELEDGTVYRPWDLSITKNVLSLFISIIIIVLIFTRIAKKYKEREGKAPRGFQSMLEVLILFIRDDIAKASMGEKKYEKYMPYLLTLFFFIFFNNLLGLVPIFPGGANLTGNIAVTLVLALFTFVITTINGNKNYWTHIFWPPVPVALKLPLMIVIELIGVFIKPFVLMVRLFANITAGHIIALGFFSLIFIFGQMSPGAGYGFSVLSVIFTIFMTLLELLVAFIQAYVFTLLSALYFSMATEEHH